MAEAFVLGLKLSPDIDVELAFEILSVERASLKLQDHLTDQLLLRRQRQRAPHRQSPLLQLTQVIFEVVNILVMDAVEMRKRGYAEPDHIAAMPERVGVNKP